MKTSVIIPSHNEGTKINDTIESLLIHNKYIHEIIIVDDCSSTPVEDDIAYKAELIKVLRLDKNRGVGYAFDRGVDIATGDIIFLMGADIRFNHDAVRDLSEIAQENPKSLIGCECIGVKDSIEFIKATQHTTNFKSDVIGRKKRLGADLKWKVTNRDMSASNPLRIDESYHDILQAKWRKFENAPKELQQIACILGATYAVNRDWYTHLKGFEGHRIWGGLEPMISIKSHLAGGDCKVASNVYTGHIFGRSPNRKSDLWNMYWNKVYMAQMFFTGDIKKELMDHVRVWRPSFAAEKEILDGWNTTFKDIREYYRTILKVDVRDTILWETWE